VPRPPGAPAGQVGFTFATDPFAACRAISAQFCADAGPGGGAGGGPAMVLLRGGEISSMGSSWGWPERRKPHGGGGQLV